MKLSLSVFFAICLGLSGCSDDGSGGVAADGGTDLRQGRDLTSQPDGRDGLDGADLDAGADAGGDGSDASADTPVTDSGGGGEDPDVGGSDAPSPSNPSVGCSTNDDCPADGDDPGVCCTSGVTYVSACATESTCSAGARDACLTDEQCGARRPGQWTVCCHDRPDRNYCGPILETCQPLVPCDTPADCASQAGDTCCSSHPYYGEGFCTSEFFANNPATDCP